MIPPLDLQPRLLRSEHKSPSQADLQILSQKLYSPIKPWQTRILRLQPGRQDEPLNCTLEVAELVCFEGVGLGAEQELVQFEALSYSWGRPALSSSLTCNGIQFPVTPNLADALFYFRSQERERLLWVDALCINQLDLSEKARYVVFRGSGYNLTVSVR